MTRRGTISRLGVDSCDARLFPRNAGILGGSSCLVLNDFWSRDILPRVAVFRLVRSKSAAQLWRTVLGCRFDGFARVRGAALPLTAALPLK